VKDDLQALSPAQGGGVFCFWKDREGGRRVNGKQYVVSTKLKRHRKEKGSEKGGSSIALYNAIDPDDDGGSDCQNRCKDRDVSVWDVNLLIQKDLFRCMGMRDSSLSPFFFLTKGINGCIIQL
jgi:hypothetical protein